MKLNASDERGIKTVRGKIKQFSQKMISGNIPCKFKLIILDEADAMTDESQYALRRIMEQYSRTTRFCIICNYITRIIEPLQSRCSNFRFKSLNDDAIKQKCKYILESEKVSYTNDGIDTIVNISKGDLRKGITYLQKLAKTKQSKITTKNINIKYDIIDNNFIQQIFDTIKSEPLDKLYNIVVDIYAHAYILSDIMDCIFEYLMSDMSNNIHNDVRAKITLLLLESSMNTHSDEFLQLFKICAFIKSLLVNSV